MKIYYIYQFAFCSTQKKHLIVDELSVDTYYTYYPPPPILSLLISSHQLDVSYHKTPDNPGGCRLTHASSKTLESSQPNFFEMLWDGAALHTYRKALSTFLHIDVLTVALNCRVSLWLTGKWESETMSFFPSRKHGQSGSLGRPTPGCCGFIRVQTRTIWRTLFCCTTWKPLETFILNLVQCQLWGKCHVTPPFLITATL